ncbi:MAG: cupin domain-containing protein [Gordonia amarae]
MSGETALPGWARGLGLRPHPEGGWFAETWRSDVAVPREALAADYPDSRAAGTAIYFLLLPGESSAWHTVRSAELWLYHRGSPVLLDLGGAGDTPEQAQAIVVGPDIAAGQQPQAIVPQRHWQRARPVGDEPSLVSCVVVPGFDFADFRLADPNH